MANYKTIKDKKPQCGVEVTVKLNGEQNQHNARLIILNEDYYWDCLDNDVVKKVDQEDLWARIPLDQNPHR